MAISANGPSWQDSYTMFKMEVASENMGFVPFVNSLPPEEVVENFTYENGRFTLTFKDEKPLCRAEHADPSWKETLSKTKVVFKKTFSGELKGSTLTFDKGSLAVSNLVTMDVKHLQGNKDYSLSIKAAWGIFSKTVTSSYTDTSQVALRWEEKDKS